MKTDEQLKAENQAIREMLASGAEEQLLAIPGVLHVSVGLKEKGGKITDELCIRVYVQEKRNQGDVPATELIPREINRVPTDVNTVGEFQSLADSTKERPIKGGIQITNRILGLIPGTAQTEFDVGTLGCIAIDNTDNSAVLLSNAHVLGAYTGSKDNKIYQPSPPSFVSPLDHPIGLADLPVRPGDGTNSIAKIKLLLMSDKVDGGIATIDVSSCCNCCGISSTNEIKGLSKDGQPPRNTIVGDERAVSGMTVFKVGQLTGRTEGRVVDDNYASVPVKFRQLGGLQRDFTGQIIIVNVDQSLPFAENGDSGSVIINASNKIVGLLFAGGPGTKFPVDKVTYPFIAAANHISDVLSEMDIRIPYSPNVVTLADAVLVEEPPIVLEASIPEPYRLLRERLQEHGGTARLFALGRRFSEEITHLINHCRPVTVAWHRCQGPAILATVMSSVRDGDYRLPKAVNGMTLNKALERMGEMLSQHGSSELKDAINEAGACILRAFRDCGDLNEAIDRIASDETLVPQGMGI